MATTTTASSSSPSSSVSDMQRKLEALRERRLEARKLNFNEVKEEDRKSKVSANDETRQARLLKEATEMKAKEEAEKQGLDYERVKNWTVSVEQAEWKEEQKHVKEKRKDHGFADHETAALRKYKRLTGAMKPDMERYNRQKELLGEDFYPTAESLPPALVTKDSTASVDHLVEDLKQQTTTRQKSSKRRQYFEEADVTFINERNFKFNQKLARAFDKYTVETKQNLERGTAL